MSGITTYYTDVYTDMNLSYGTVFVPDTYILLYTIVNTSLTVCVQEEGE